MSNNIKKQASGIKLTKAQSEVIKTLQKGVTCHHINGIDARCFFRGNPRCISWATIYKLEVLGLIERGRDFVVLTDEGRAFKQ